MEHSRTAESNELPARTPQHELRRSRLLEEMQPPTEHLSAAAARVSLSAPGAGENRLELSGGGV